MYNVELNKMIDVAQNMPQTQQQASMVQDNVAKTQFALNMMERLSQRPKHEDTPPPKIPSLGALAIPS